MNNNNLRLQEDVYQAYKKDFQNGVVTVGNICNANCFFCSQKWNPPGVVQDLKRFLTVEEIGHFSRRYLKEIFLIGSAIHVNSGEFFFHPQASEILTMLSRGRELSGTPIFTNGKGLNEKHARLLKRLKLRVSLSISSTDCFPWGRASGGSRLSEFSESLIMLQKHKVDSSVWVVPCKTAFRNGELRSLMGFLKKYKVKTVLLHRPGYTRFTPAKIAEELTLPDALLLDFVAKIRKQEKINLLFELPPPRQLLQELYFLLGQVLQTRGIRRKKKLFLCPVCLEEKIRLLLEVLDPGEYMVKAVRAGVFGGNVDCAGLLMIKDYIAAVDEFLRFNRGWVPEAMILPRNSFDVNLEDLSTEPLSTLQKRYHAGVILA